MTDGGGRNAGLGKKENSELLRILLFSNNWNLYDKYMHIHRHRALEPLLCCCLTWDIYRDMKSPQNEVFNNLALTPYEVFPEVLRDVYDHIYLIVMVLNRWESPQRNCFRVVFTGQDRLQ